MRFLWVLIWVITWFELTAQSGQIRINNRHLNVENGLSQREVMTLYEDTQGFIWAGTQAGLNFFDGYIFHQFSGLEYGLQMDTIKQIVEDDEGWLWLFNENQGRGALGFYRRENNQVHLFDQRFGPIAPFSLSQVHSLQMLPDRTILLLLKDNVVWRYRTTEGFRRLALPKNLHLVRVLATGRLLCRKDNLFAVTNAEGQILEWLPHPGLKVINYFEFSDKGWLVLTHDATLHLVEQMPGTGPRWKRSIFNWTGGIDVVPAVKVIVHPINQTIFIANGADFFILAPIGEDNKDLTVLYSQRFDRSIRQLMFDNRGTVWIATENGVYLFRVEPSLFQQIPAQKGPKVPLIARGIASGSDEQLYVAQENSKMAVCDPATGLCKPVPLSDLQVWSVASSPDGNIWLAGTSLAEFVPGHGVVRLFRDNGDQILQFWSLVQRSNGKWWLGAEKGLYELNTAVSNHIFPCDRYNSTGDLKNSRILQILPAGPGQFWLATNSGLYWLDETREMVERYWPGGTGRYYLPSMEIQFIYRDLEGVFWLATSGQGLLRWEPDVPAVRKFTRMEGLSSNILYAIYEDTHHSLWISSANGIMRFDKKTFASQVFLPQDGISHYEFNRISHYRAPNGRIYFGSIDGITAFYPDAFYNDSAYHVPLKIARAQRYDVQKGTFIDIMPVPGDGATIDLPSGSRLVTLTLSLQDYFYASQAKYEYAFEGEPGWIAVSGNELRLSTLPYGQHTLLVRARGAQGRYSDNRLQMTITVPRPVYMRWWFLSGVAFLVVFGVIIGISWRTRRLLTRQRELETAVQERTERITADKIIIEEQAAELRQLDQAKSRFFANISHELRTPLTLISGPAEHLIQHYRQLPAEVSASLHHIMRNSRKLLGLVEEMLDLSRLDARRIELKNAPVAFRPFCNRVFASFESMARWNGLEYSLEYRLENDLVLNLDSSRLEKILNNLLANAVQHASPGAKVRMEVEREEDFVVLRVCDTGSGIHPDDLPYVFNRYYQSRQTEKKEMGGAGIGLALALELAHLMGGRLTAKSRWREGSVFTLYIPEERSTGTVNDTKVIELSDPGRLPVRTDITDFPTLLVVEDNVDMQEHLQIILGTDYQIIAAANGSQAWNWLEKDESALENVRLIISDVMMPEMDGFELLERIKQHPRWKHLPIVLLTARSGEQDKLLGLRLGVDDYLTKPFSAAELHARLRNLLARPDRRPVSAKAAAPPIEPSADDRLLQQIAAAARQALEEKRPLSVLGLAEVLYLSQRTLQRKIKELTGLTPSQYLLECRLDRARYLLENRVYNTVRETAFAVGFETPHYFSAVYEQRFGKTPTRYLNPE
jgi:signal transduction histidine kinase/DNA-binding response OmpR family regulator/ligand-binding sensor domain-containing protein